MANLYDLDQRMLQFETTGVDMETGEVATTEEDFQRIFDEIDMDLKTKMINVACYIKNIRSDIEQYDAEIDRLKQRKQSKVNLANRLETLLDFVAKHRVNNVDEDFEATNKWKIDDPRAVISYRRSEKLNITDETLIPSEYKTQEVKEKIDMNSIKSAIKGGADIKGAELVSNLNLQIK